VNAVGELLRVKEAADRGEARRDLRIVAALSAASLVYATVRYNVSKGVPWADWPVYVVNKAVGLCALALLAASVLAMLKGRPARRLLAWAGGAVLLHVAASLAILNPVYFPKFFRASKLTVVAGASLMIGAAAAVGMEVGARKAAGMSSKSRVWAIAAIAFASGVHAGMTGVPGWFAPADWPGRLPPITLISFLLGSVAILSAWRTLHNSTHGS